MHPIATEHGFILSGAVRCLILDGSETEYEFNEGDFFVVRPGQAYATKNAAGTKVLFIKSPGVNDKTAIKINDTTKEWLKSWD